MVVVAACGNGFGSSYCGVGGCAVRVGCGWLLFVVCCLLLLFSMDPRQESSAAAPSSSTVVVGCCRLRLVVVGCCLFSVVCSLLFVACHVGKF